MIGFLPYELRKEPDLNNIDLSMLDWPLENTKPAGIIGDLSNTDDILIYPCSRIILRKLPNTPCPISLIMVEPFAVQRRYYWILQRFLWRKFKYIFSRYTFLIEKIPNLHLVPVSKSFVNHKTVPQIQKIKMISLISSSKRKLIGHKLRHKVVKKIRSINLHVEIIGRGYKPFKEKFDGLSPYKYSIIIENSREPDYFSEKLLDCLICECIPIYWGASNISEYFNMASIIECESLEDIVNAIGSVEDFNIEDVQYAVEENKSKAIGYSRVETNIANIITNLNNKN